MDNAEGWLFFHFGSALIYAHDMVLVPVGVAPLVLKQAREFGLRALGAEGFELLDDGSIRPRLDRIADFSSGEPEDTVLNPWLVDRELVVEFVFDQDPQTVFVIDGDDFDDLAGFFHVASDALMNVGWEMGNLDGFNDILRGGFLKTPDGGYTLVWRNAARSSRMLGHSATAAWLRVALERAHSSNHDSMRIRLEQAERGEGSTLFEILVDIILSHCSGGREGDDGVQFILRS